MANDLDGDATPVSARNICRVCSSRGEYDVFAAIPAYLHACTNDYLYWKKDISTLLEETTGLSIHENDGLPRKICAVCISYLKHAATFRQQVIDNTLSLKTVQAVLDGRKDDRLGHGCMKIDQEFEPDDKYGLGMSEADLIFNDIRKTDTNIFVNNSAFNNFSTSKTKDNTNKFSVLNCRPSDEPNKSDGSNLNSYLNLLFDRKPDIAQNVKPKKTNMSFFDHNDSVGEEFHTASSDDTEAFDKGNFFNYNEKNFVEDDVMSLDFIKDANIVINIPEHVRERKCPACFRRFMFEDSYKEHMNSCLQFKFIILIENLNRLLNFRKIRAISPHEFIRRMIFCLKGTCQYLNESCGEEIAMPDLLVNSEIKSNVPPSIESNSTDLIVVGENDRSGRVSEPDPLLNLLRERADPSFVRYMCDSPSGRHSHTTDTASISHSPPSNIIKLDSTNSDNSPNTSNTDENVTIRSNPTGRKSLIESFNKVANDHHTSTPKLDLVFGSIKMNFSARCNACHTVFESIGALEDHNSKFHNNRKKSEDHKRIIAMFESDDNEKIGVDAAASCNGDAMMPKKIMIKCVTCDMKFPTLMHLDQHKIKCVSSKPPYKRFM